MPKIKVSHIVSFSSEDPHFPASNLLRSENYRKWKCKEPGEKEATVLLQLEKAEKIDAIDIGNESSAFVEVFVGRSSNSEDEFKVLLLTSSFMSPMEARNVTNVNRVRMFSADKLDKNTVGEKWDRVKIVCTQPFNKHIQYGLSFITLHSPSDKKETKNQINFGGFALRDDKIEDDIKTGSLFEDYKETHKFGLLKGAAAIREASNTGVIASKAQTETKALLKELEEKKKKNESKNEVLPPKKNLARERSPQDKGKVNVKITEASDDGSTRSGEEAGNSLNHTKVKANERGRDSEKRNTQSSEMCSQPKRIKKDNHPSATKKCQRKPFKKLFEGVVFVISGFQNPSRGNIRSMALEMGAKYKPDWENSCTHLICAFPNTPKFLQVLGKGHIVSKEWVEESHAKRRRLPWRRFAMAKHEKGKEESEEEILEEIDEPAPGDHQISDVFCSADRGAPSGSDTDDEIQRCMEESRKAAVRSQSNSKESDCYNCETEEDDENEDSETGGNKSVNRKIPLDVPKLPDFFSGCVFYIFPKVDSRTRNELKRHIVAFKGKIAENLNEDVTHILLEETGGIEELLTSTEHSPRILKLQWIWDCNDAGQLLPMDKYLLT